MDPFRLVTCPECGEEFRIEVSITCPECKAVYPNAMEREVREPIKESLPKPAAVITPKEITSEERLASIEHLLYKIHRNVAYFAWVLSLTLAVGFFWLIENS